jgi:ABC-type nitrate/sulfonate/bicarbonate transport system ATPase subunit
MFKKLEVKNLYVKYNSLEVLKNINIVVNKGEFISVVGPSGCGKSTLFHHISGLLKPYSGEIFINDEKVNGKTNKVAYMYQKDLLLPWRKIIDNVSIPLEINKLPKKERIKKSQEYFKIFGLEGFENYYPDELSGGMRQRVALMRTYMCKKDIMLLDEPFGRLDAITKIKMQKWLKSVLSSIKGSILFITHDIEEAIYLSNRIYVFSKRPATVIKEVNIKIDKNDFIECTTSEEFNKLKAEIINLQNFN